MCTAFPLWPGEREVLRALLTRNLIAAVENHVRSGSSVFSGTDIWILLGITSELKDAQPTGSWPTKLPPYA